MSAPTRRKAPRSTWKPPPAAQRPLESPQTPAQQAHGALVAAGVRGQVGRIVVSRSAPGEPGDARTVALLTVGADPAAVAAALGGLSGVVHTHVGESAVAVYREAP